MIIFDLNKQLPDKSQGSLVTFYYTWKKNKCLISAMEQHQITGGSKNNNENRNEYNGNGLSNKNENGNEDNDKIMNSDDSSDSIEQNFDVNILYFYS